MHLLSGRAAVTPFFHQPARTYVHRISCAAAAGILLALTIGVAAPAAAQIGKTVDGPKVVPFDLNIDLRLLPKLPAGSVAPKLYRPLLKGPQGAKSGGGAAPSAPAGTPGARAPMPGTIQNFAGLNFADLCGGVQCGGGWPPDPNGEVGPNHFIEAVNVGYAIYNKTGTLLASFTEDQLWAGSGANLCNGNSQGDPIVVYDPIADRWIITHFAFASGSGTFRAMHRRVEDERSGRGRMVSVSAAHRHWSRRTATGRLDQRLSEIRRLARLPVHGRQPVQRIRSVPGRVRSHRSAAPIYITAIRLPGRSASCLTRPTRCSACFLRTVPARVRRPSSPGRRAFFVNESTTAFNFDVRKLTPGPNCGGGGTLSAATFVPQTVYTGTAFGTSVPQPNTANLLDNLADRIMQKVQYRKVGAAESLWVVHTVPLASNQSAIQWAQLDVTGGTIAATAVQQQIYSPDTTLYRFMPSIAADNQGNVAIGFSTSGATVPEFPEHQVRRTACRRPAQHAAADGSHARRGARFADESSAAAVRAIAGATTRR